MKILIILSLISNLCYADDIIFLNKDDKAPSPGYLFSESKTKEVRIKILERDSFESINASITKQNLFLTDIAEQKDKQLTFAMERMDSLATSLREERSTSNWERTGYFAAGILTTIGILYGLKAATR